MTTLRKSLKRIALLMLLLGGGVYFAGTALWSMAKTAIFLHESTVLTARVVDMVQYPFESYTQAMKYGNLPWEGDTAYRATVRFTLPTTPVAIEIARMELADLDNRDYAVGQEVEIIVPLTDPARAHLYRWKFLWGADCMLLALGLLLACPAYLMLRRIGKTPKTAARKKEQAKPAANAPRPAPRKESKAAKAPKAVKAPEPEPEEDVFRLESTPPEPKKKRSRKKKSEGGTSVPKSGKSTGTRRKKSGAA